MRCLIVLALVPALLLPLAGCDQPASTEPPTSRQSQTTEPEFLTSDAVLKILHSSPKYSCAGGILEWESSLFRAGELAYPAFETILADPKSDPSDVVWLCLIISEQKADRRRFVPTVVRRLTDPNAMFAGEGIIREALTAKYLWHFGEQDTEPTVLSRGLYCMMRIAETRSAVRCFAMQLLREIGNGNDAGAVVPHLSDPMEKARCAAAWTLAKIGSRQHLAAIDESLKRDDPRRDDKELQHFKNCRDELAKRLKEHPFPKNLIN